MKPTLSYEERLRLSTTDEWLYVLLTPVACGTPPLVFLIWFLLRGNVFSLPFFPVVIAFLAFCFVFMCYATWSLIATKQRHVEFWQSNFIVWFLHWRLFPFETEIGPVSDDKLEELVQTVASKTRWGKVLIGRTIKNKNHVYVRAFNRKVLTFMKLKYAGMGY